MAGPLQQTWTSCQAPDWLPLLQEKRSKLARPTVAPPPSLREEVTGIETPKPKSAISMAPFFAMPGSGSDVDSPLMAEASLNNKYALNAINYLFPFFVFGLTELLAKAAGTIP